VWKYKTICRFGDSNLVIFALRFTGLPGKSFFEDEQRRAEGYRNRYFALNAYERHKKLVNDYLLYYPGAGAQLLKRDE
jgi:hypothetical protein